MSFEAPANDTVHEEQALLPASGVFQCNEEQTLLFS